MSGCTNLPKEFKISKSFILLFGWNLHQYGLQSQKRMFRSVSKLSTPLESWILVLQNLNLFFCEWGRRHGQTNWEEPCRTRPGFPSSFREAGDGLSGIYLDPPPIATLPLVQKQQGPIWALSRRNLGDHKVEKVNGKAKGWWFSVPTCLLSCVAACYTSAWTLLAAHQILHRAVLQ